MRAPLLVLLLWFTGLGAAAQFAKIAVPFGLVREAWPGAGEGIGWLLSIISLVGAVLGVVAGDLVVRLGAKRMLVAGLLSGAAIALWQATVPPFAPMLAGRLLEGVSHLAIVVAAPTLIVRISPPRLAGAAMTLWSTFFGVSFALVAWVIVPFLGQGGIATLFLAHGLAMLVLGLLALLVLPGPERAPAPADARPGLLARHAQAYASPAIAAPAAGWLFYTLTFVSLVALLPERLPPRHAAWATGSMPLVSVAVSLLAVPLLLRRLPGVAVIVLGFALAAALVAVALPLDLGLSFAIALFAALGLVQGASFAAVPELNATHEDRALAYGLMAQAGNTGNLLGTPLLLAVLGAHGAAGMHVTVAALYLLGIAIHLLLMHRRTRNPLPPDARGGRTRRG